MNYNFHKNDLKYYFLYCLYYSVAPGATEQEINEKITNSLSKMGFKKTGNTAILPPLFLGLPKSGKTTLLNSALSECIEELGIQALEINSAQQLIQLEKDNKNSSVTLPPIVIVDINRDPNIVKNFSILKALAPLPKIIVKIDDLTLLERSTHLSLKSLFDKENIFLAAAADSTLINKIPPFIYDRFNVKNISASSLEQKIAKERQEASSNLFSLPSSSPVYKHKYGNNY